MKNFQTILLIVFGVFIAAGMAIFSGFIPVGKSASEQQGFSGTVTIWGTLAPGFFKDYIDVLQQKNEGFVVKYVSKNEATYYDELVQALASGTGPDLFVLSGDKIVEHKNKVLPIPYANYPVELFQQNYIDEGALFLSPDGIVALPFLIDPLVLYYNRDLLTSAFIINPPQYWDELLALAPKLTKKSETGAITQAAIPLGTANNINHAKDILSVLAIQGGVPIVGQDATGVYQEAFYGSDTGSIESALRFYTSFANPSQEQYAWNAGLRNSFDAFIAEESAMYIGYASEMGTIRARNPNLNFDVTLIPQTRDTKLQTTTGRIWAFAISKQSQNVASAYNLVNLFSNPDYVAIFSERLMLPPVRRDVLTGNVPATAFMRTFYNSAIISRSWWDPHQEKTDVIFKKMITDTLSGAARADEAVREGRAEMRRLLGNE